MTGPGRGGVRKQDLVEIVLQFEESQWRCVKPAMLRRAARTALQACGRSGSLTILLAGDDRLQELNEKYRRKAAPTNVLSFPALRNGEAYLGDIAVAFGVTSREAADSNKALRDHTAHLVVHGVLHLLGYDHVTAKDARVMEALEVDILGRMGIGDPYAAPMAAE